MSSSKIQARNIDNSVMSKTSVSLAVGSWNNNSQTVTCIGVTADNAIVTSPAPESIESYGKAEVKCMSQSLNSLTFTCSKTPETTLNINVLILGV